MGLRLTRSARRLMCLFGVGQLFGRVLGEIGLEKAFGLRQREMEVGQRLHS